jgi:actin-related protein 5
MYSSTDPANIVRLPTSYLPLSVPIPEIYDDYRDAHTPIIIDNGSTNFRWGFGTSSTPLTALNTVARYKERKTNRPLLLFGDAIDSESGARAHAKTPWEGDVLLNFDALVGLAFSILG